MKRQDDKSDCSRREYVAEILFQIILWIYVLHAVIVGAVVAVNNHSVWLFFAGSFGALLFGFIFLPIIALTGPNIPLCIGCVAFLALVIFALWLSNDKVADKRRADKRALAELREKLRQTEERHTAFIEDLPGIKRTVETITKEDIDQAFIDGVITQQERSEYRFNLVLYRNMVKDENLRLASYESEEEQLRKLIAKKAKEVEEAENGRNK